MISPTIIPKQTLAFNNNIEFHPSGNTLITTIKGFSEIIVGDIMVKSPYEIFLPRALAIAALEGIYYTVMYYTILYYTILYYDLIYYDITSYDILYYNMLYYTILYYNIIYY